LQELGHVEKEVMSDDGVSTVPREGARKRKATGKKERGVAVGREE
jgi:hypothetical protein